MEIHERSKIDDKIMAVLMEFHQIFLDFIEIESDNRARSFSSSKVLPKIKLLPNIKGTWLDTPKPVFKSDEIGSWPKDTKFPTADKSLLPNNNILKIPSPIPVLIHDEILRDFLEGKSLLDGDKVQLPSFAFEPSSLNVDRSSNFALFDSLSRKGLLENFITDQLIDKQLKFVRDILSNWDELTNHTFLKRMIATLENLTMLSFQSSLRAQQYMIALFVTNKKAFRKYILDQCNGSEDTKDILKGTCFATPTLFGDIPESFLKKFDNSAFQFNRYVLRPSKNLPGGSGYKTQSDRSGAPPNKRSKPDYRQFNRSTTYNPNKSSSSVNYEFFREGGSNKRKRGGHYSSSKKK